MDWLIGAFGGAIFGFGTAATGILKNKTKDDYKGIDVVKAGTTVVLTTLAGAVVGAQNIGLTEEALGFMVSNFSAVGISEWVSNLLKAVYAYLQK